MPRQETFLHESADGVTVDVLKIYDRQYAREVFEKLSDEAMDTLAAALEIKETYDPEDIPSAGSAEYEDFLWEELCESAREDVRQSPILDSFFVVSETKDGKGEDLYVSPDWPSAEGYALKRIALAK
jgi:hypothetical protein